MSQTVVLKVKMSCSGCSGAVKRVLDKTEGVESYDVNMEEQKVTVIGNLPAEAVLQAVSKSGKKTELWEDTTPVVESEKTTADIQTEAADAETKTTEIVEAETKSTETVETETKPVKAAAETETHPAEVVAAP